MPDLAKELNVDPMAIHMVIMNSKEDIEGQFLKRRDKVEGHKGIVNVYVKK